MADSNSKELLTIEELKKRLLSLDAKAENYAKKSSDYSKRKLREVQKEKKELEAIVKLREAENKEFLSLSKQYNRLSGDLKKALGAVKDEVSAYQSLNTAVAKYSAITKENSDDSDSQAKLDVLQDISSEALQQAKATQRAEENLRGLTSYDSKRKELLENSVGLTEDEVQQSLAVLENTEKLRLKEERLNQLAEERKSVFQSLPGPIQNMVNGAEKFGKALMNGALPMVLLASIAIAALTSFTKLDESAKSFRETTGLTNSQMEGIKSQANDITGEFAAMGVDADKVFNTVAGLKSEFSDIANFSDEVVAGLTLLNTNFGVSAESAAKVQGIFEQIGGLTSETAAGVQLQVANMAKLAGVAPAKVFEDIAENAEIASTLFQGDVESLTKAAIEARRLGTNLKSVASTTEHLLDFQSNIGDELTAATFVGGQFNLTQARSLAAAGKTVEAQKEVLKQLQRSGDFRKQDYFTQQQLAKAAGMSVEEINKQLNAQEKLNSLSSEQRALADKAIEQGLDISNIDKDQLASQVQQFSKQQEMQASVEKLTNAFTGIAAAIGSAIVPALDGVMEVINPIAQVVGSIVSFFAQIPGFFPAIIAGLTTMYILQKRAAIQAFFAAIPKIFSSFASIPFGLGIPLAVGAVAGLASMMSKKPKVADDMYSPPGYGSRVLTGPEGSIALNNNDTVLAGTNLGGGGDNGKMDALIAAVKETKDVYMDGRRVTGRVGRVVDNSAKNNFAFG
jgi:hypothetical protein